MERKGLSMHQHIGWQLSGSAPEAYEQYIGQVILSEWTRDLVEVAAVREGERVLDTACGTGMVVRHVARHVGTGGHVVGLDINASMLEMARALLPQLAGASVTWREGNVQALPFPPAAFDVVLCQQGLQFFPDKPGALREIHRVLMPGGRLILSVLRGFQHCPWQRTLAEALARHVSAEAAASMQEVCSLGEAEELRALLTGAGFRAIHIRIESKLIRYGSLEAFALGYLAASPMARTVAALDEASRTAFLRDLRTALRGYIDDDGLAVPNESHVVVAHREK